MLSAERRSAEMDVERGGRLLPGAADDSDDDGGYASQDDLEAPGDVTIQRLVGARPGSPAAATRGRVGCGLVLVSSNRL